MNEYTVMEILKLPIILDITKLSMSVILSSLIGMERETNDKPAGVRTSMLICFGATLAILFVSKFYNAGIGSRVDLSRLPAYYLAGWGFLGAGIINKSTRGGIEGITTASLLLPLSIIGFLCGAGQFALAIIGTLFIYGILNVKYIQIKIKKQRRKKTKRK